MNDVQTVQPEEIDGRFSEVIDVRSPGEYAEDRVPSAVNLPVLDDAERVEVGTLYRQVSPFAARRRGAALIAANISRQLTGHFADKPPGYRPLVYCWRGGQRSNSLATILAAVGWPVTLLDGGYKAYRRWVREELAERLAPGRAPALRIVAGLTGTGKTRLLAALAELGEQVIDLEALANHRGSILGREFPDPVQPSQKQFENRVFEAVRSVDRDRPVFVESESNKIGDLHVPAPLWAIMRGAPMVELVAEPGKRARFLLDDYAHFRHQPGLLRGKLDELRRVAGHANVDRWLALVDAGRWEDFVADLLTSHYDAAYLRSRGKIYGQAAARVELDPGDAPSLRAAAAAVARAVPAS